MDLIIIAIVVCSIVFHFIVTMCHGSDLEDTIFSTLAYLIMWIVFGFVGLLIYQGTLKAFL